MSVGTADHQKGGKQGRDDHVKHLSTQTPSTEVFFPYLPSALAQGSESRIYSHKVRTSMVGHTQDVPRNVITVNSSSPTQNSSSHAVSTSYFTVNNLSPSLNSSSHTPNSSSHIPNSSSHTPNSSSHIPNSSSPTLNSFSYNKCNTCHYVGGLYT